MGVCLVSSGFKFTNNSGKAKQQLQDAADKGLEAALMIMEARIKRNAPVNLGDLRDSIDHKRSRTGDITWGQVGSPLTYAIYVEFGTGEFAENGAGRKGGWVYQDPSGEWFFTWGQEAQHFIRRAYQSERAKAEQIIARTLGENLIPRKSKKGGDK